MIENNNTYTDVKVTKDSTKVRVLRILRWGKGSGLGSMLLEMRSRLGS